MALPSTLPAPGTEPGHSVLDGPPPSPAVESGMSPGPSPSDTGVGGVGGLGSLVPPIPSGALPPEVLTGVVQTGEQMVQTLDSFMQMMPDLTPDFSVVKDALKRALARVLQAGAGPTSPQAAGPGFPGGGFDSGGMPAA